MSLRDDFLKGLKKRGYTITPSGEVKRTTTAKSNNSSSGNNTRTVKKSGNNLTNDFLNGLQKRNFTMTDDDIAPVKQTVKVTDDDVYDGWDFANDAASFIVKGLGNIVEPFVDRHMNNFADLADLIGMDKAANKVREESKKDTVNNLELDFFNAPSVLDDGYDSGDISHIILGSTGDAGFNILKGGASLVEGIADTVQYGQSFVAGKMGMDEYAKKSKEMAMQNTIDKYTQGLQDFLNQYSVFGETSKGVAQGVGQAAAIAATGGAAGAAGLSGAGVSAVTSGLMFGSGFGSGMSEAYEGGATDEEAVTYGLISATADTLSEMLWGGMGKSVNAIGLSKGLSSADDILAQTISKNMKSQVAKNFTEFGIKAGAEGVEEVLAGLAQAFGKKLTYMSEEDIAKIIEDEKLFEQFVVGAFSSAAMQSGAVPGMKSGSLAEANKNKTDFITGQTQNEQAVIKKEVENRIAEMEADGMKLSRKQKSDIEAQVAKDMEKGYISIDTIEEVLGGDTYKSYKDTADREDAIQNEFDTLNKMKQGDMTGEQVDRRESLRKQLEEIKNTSKRNELKTKLGEEVFGLAQNDRLAESYNERSRRGQTFEADLSQYDKKQQDTIKKAIDSGILNNTNRTHEFVDMIAKISADKGVLFDFTNNEKLKDSSFAVNGKTVNGFVTKDGVTLNINSAKALEKVVGHEITHVLEGTDFYNELQNAVIEYAKSKGDYQGRYDSLSELYKDIKDANIDAELTADLVGDYLFSDTDFINNLSTKNRNVFQKIFDEIKYLCKVATAGSKESRELEKVKRAFEKAYKAGAKNTVTNGGINYAIDFSGTQENAGILSIVEKIQRDPTGYNQKEYVSFGTVDNSIAKRIKQTIGIDPTGYEVVIEARQIKHILNDHGPSGKSDQSMADPSTISKIEYALKNPDDLSDGGVTHAYMNNVDGKNRPVRTVLYERIVSEDGKSMYAVQGVPVSSKKKLYIVTAFVGESGYKNRASQFADANSPGATAKTAAVNALNDKLPQNGNGVNGKISLNELTDDGLTMTYVRVPNQNTQNYGSTYGQNIEPAGEYMSMDTMQGKNKIDGYEYGTIQFKKPLVLEHINTSDTGWKKTVSDMYNGLTGKKLTDALIKDGYDAIVTYDDYGYSEIVNLNGKKLNDNDSGQFSLSEGKVYNRTVVLNESTVDKYLSDYAAKGSPNYARAYIAHMTPEQFLGLTTSPGGRSRIQAESKALNAEELGEASRQQPIQLMINHETGEVLGHEGRHRVQAMLDEGIENIPVLLFDSSNKYDKSVIDTIRLTGQDFGNSRSYANAYVHDVTPLSYANRDSVVGRFATQPKSESFYERYGTKETLRYSLSDSNGKQLTKGQQEYFKDSKVRDDNGNLMVMYHGSENGGFHEFNARFSDDNTSFFFTDSPEIAESYSGSSEVYTAKTLNTPEDFRNFLNEIGETDYEVVGNDGDYWVLDVDGDTVAKSDSIRKLYEEFCEYMGIGEGAVNYKSYLNLTNPLIIDAESRNWDNVTSEFSEEIVERIQSLTEDEKTSLTQLASWEDIGIFRDEIRQALINAEQGTTGVFDDAYTKNLASAWNKFGGRNGDIYRLFDMASDNFTEDSIAENAYKKWTTRDHAQWAKGNGYDGVIFKNIVDVGGYGNGSKTSTVAIAFDSNQIKSVANENPTSDADIRYSLSDNKGNAVAPAMQKRMENSQVRDEEGKLKVVYHGSGADFTVFSYDFMSSHGSSEGQGFYFTDKKEMAKGYQKNGTKLLEGYLDIKKPLSDSEVTIKRNELAKILKAIDPSGDDVLVNYDPSGGAGYPSQAWYNRALAGTVDSMLQYNESDSEILADIANSGAGTQVVLENVRKLLGYDGYIVSGKYDDATVYVAFESNQFKSIDNQNPTDNPDINMSISNNGETGNGRFIGKDLALEVAPVAENATTENVAPVVDVSKKETTTEELFPDDLAPIPAEIEKLYDQKQQLENDMRSAMAVDDVTALESINEEYNKVMERISTLEADETARVNSLDDSNAPPEMEAPYYGESETVTLTKKATDDIARNVRQTLGLSNNDMATARSIIEKYRTGEISTREQLIAELQDNFGTYTEITRDDILAEVQSELRSRGIRVSDTIKHGIADYRQVMRKNWGKIRFSKNGLAVDQVYKELGSEDMYPDYFPESITNPEDQLLRMIEVANMNVNTETEVAKDIESFEDAADAIISSIDNFRKTQDETLAKRAYKVAFDDLVKNADQYAPEDIAPVVETQTVQETKKQTEKPTVKPTENHVFSEQLSLWDKEKKTPNPNIAQILETEPDTTPKRRSRAWAKFRAAVVDKGAVFEDLSLKTKNRQLMGDWQKILYSQGIAQNFIGKGEGNVPSLVSVQEEVSKSGKEKKFTYYLYHLHNADRMSLAERFPGMENKPVYGDTITSEMSRKSAAVLENANPEFKEWAKKIYAINKHNRDLLVEAELITPEITDLWEKMYPHYVPVRREGDTGLNISVPLDTNKTGVNNPIKRATGGSKNILPLFDTMAQRTIQTYKAIAKNQFGTELKNTLGTTIASEANTVDGIIDSIASPEGLLQEGKDGLNPTFTVFENGERVTFEITPDMYDALKPVSEGLKYTNKVLGTMGNLHKKLLTEYNPVFLMTNAVKDLQDVLINSQHPARTYAKIPEAYAQMAVKGHWYKEYVANGGEQNTYFDSESNKFTKESAFGKVVKFPLNAISAVNNFIEMSPRLAEYIASREAGKSVEVSMLDAARVTTNFAASGDFARLLNRNGCTFLTASISGAAQQVRNFREAKSKGLKGWLGLATRFAIAGLPAILLNNLMWDDDEEYEELSDYVKQGYYVVGKTEDGKFIRIPKGRTVAVIQNAIDQMGKMVSGDDEADWGTFLELAISNLAPNNPLDNNIIAPIVQVANNKTWYGEDLVPSRLQDVPEVEQYDESTDSISKWLGEKLNISPYKINYLLNQYSGGLGDVVLPMLTPEAESGDDSLLGNLLAPMKDKFTTDGTMNNQNVSYFYDTMDTLKVNSNSMYATEEDLLKYKYMNAVNSDLSELYQQKREIQNSDLSDAEKFEKVHEIQSQIVDRMRESLGNYDALEIQGGNYVEIGGYHFDKDEDGKWWRINDQQLEKQNEVTEALGITPSEYWSNREEYNYAYEKPEQYQVARVCGGYDSYRAYQSDLWDIKADKDKNGKSIAYSRKEKVIEYINEMDADYGTKIILFKNEYNADDTYNYEIIDYLNSRDDISYEQTETILKYLGFNVDSEGNITWD